MGAAQRHTRDAASRVVELGAAIAESGFDSRGPLTRASYEPLLPSIAGAIGAARILSYRPVCSGERWDWEFASYWSGHEGGARELAGLGELMRARRLTWSFRPHAPAEAGQRNRVVSTRDPAMRGYAPKLRAIGDAIGARAQISHALRVLVCDGPRLLGVFGCMRDHAFVENERKALQALVPSLARAHRLQRVARERAFFSAGVDAVLELLAEPAFLLDRRGAIRHANRAGERWIARIGRSDCAAERIAAVARGGRSDGDSHALPDGNGSIVVMRCGAPRPSARLRRSSEAWDLTPRQVEVLGYVIDGRTNKEAAAALRCTEGNIELHVTNLLRRSGSANRAELVSKFWQL